jgi:beta-glucanase (GH16 family)
VRLVGSNLTDMIPLILCSPHIAQKQPFSLKNIGEMGVVTTKADSQGKLTNHGTTCMFMGYSIDHSNDEFQMLNLETRRIINSRDLILLGKNYKMLSNTDSQSEKNDIDDHPGDLILNLKKGVKSAMIFNLN